MFKRIGPKQMKSSEHPSSKSYLWLFPFSTLDWVLSGFVLVIVITIWYLGDFHLLHDSDSILYSAISLYRLTPFAWEYDHGGALLSFIINGIQRPYWNVFALSSLCSFMFLAGLTIWGSLLPYNKHTLTESSLWVSLLVPIVLQKDRIFDNAAHVATFGASFFFAALYTLGVIHYLRSPRNSTAFISAFLLYIPGFSAIYLAKNTIVPLAVITAALIWQYSYPTIRARAFQWKLIVTLLFRSAMKGEKSTRWDQILSCLHRFPINLLLPGISLVLSLLTYQLLEQAAPIKNDFTFDLIYIPKALPQLLRNWSAQEVTSPLWFLIPLPFLLYKPSVWHRRNPLLTYLTAGVIVESFAVSSSRWVIPNHFKGYYLTDLDFLLILMILVFAAFSVNRITLRILRGSSLMAVALLSVYVNAQLWNSFALTSPFTGMDNTIGANTSSFVDGQCDIIAGDYWKVWPAVIATNDYYYRENIIDPRTGRLRLVAGIAQRAGPTEYLWRPILDQPGVRICSLVGDEDGFNRSISTYAPEIALQTVPTTKIGQVIVHRIRIKPLQSVTLEFDQLLPGKGWSFGEVGPTGETFQWMDNTEATIILPLMTDRDVSVEFRILHIMSPDILQSLTLFVNGQSVELTRRHDPEGAPIFIGVIPKAVIVSDSRFTILTFRVSHTLIPHLIFPNSDDIRTLGLAFDWLRIERQP